MDIKLEAGGPLGKAITVSNRGPMDTVFGEGMAALAWPLPTVARHQSIATVSGCAILMVLATCWPAWASEVHREAGHHWAFQPVRVPDLGAFASDQPALNPIDRFIAAKQHTAGTRPVPLADRLTLIRRAYFDLTGLPPSPEQVRAFLDDAEPGAWTRLVEELLASPRYGERWGRHWLDLVRYADTAGDDSDYPIPEAALYRNYVIDAFNADLPYDRFLQEQIAGDLLAKEGPSERFADQVVATGYIAQSKRFATHKHEDMHLIIEDTLHTTGEAILGLTFRCARCHDHKYDPTTMEDYYALYGFFSSTVYPHPGSEENTKPNEFIPLVPEPQLQGLVAAFKSEHGPRLETLESQIKRIEEEIKDKKEQKEKTAALRKELAEIQRQDPRISSPLAYAVKEGTPADVEIQKGGDPRRKGHVSPRDVPRFLGGHGTLQIPKGTSGRLELARWLSSPENPLTARVMANRIWQHHFGKGLVATPSNFGLQGEPPTHPELLDWLASQFMQSGWSIKAMHRLILHSETWRRASAHDPAMAEIDPANNTYWHFDRRRLDAEALRDTLLLIGGNLDLDRPGPHPFPSVNSWSFTAHHQFKAVYPSNHRTVFLMVQRLHPHPYLSLFNGPDTTASTPVRDASTVPLQALFMANSEFVHAQAAGLARQLQAAASDPRARVDRAYQTLFGRPATTAECARALKYLDDYQAVLKAESAPAASCASEPWSSLARVLLASNEFASVD